MGAPQTLQALQFGYTATSAAIATQPGTWEWQPLRSRVVATFGSFDAGNGPPVPLTDFTADVLVNGPAALSIIVPGGQDQGDASVGPPVVILFAGDLIQFDITADGGATGPVELGFVYY